MPAIVSRKDKLDQPKERKFKPFKKTIAFDDRDDAFEFASIIEGSYPEIAKEIVLSATR